MGWSRPVIRGCLSLAAIAVVALLVFPLSSPPGVLAGVTGSPHDFSSTGPSTKSSTISPSGSCTACHIPHRSKPITLNNTERIQMWPRDLDLNNNGYKARLSVDGVRSTKGINYVPGRTIGCYDCHDPGNVYPHPSNIVGPGESRVSIHHYIAPTLQTARPPATERTCLAEYLGYVAINATACPDDPFFRRSLHHACFSVIDAIAS